MKTKSIVRRALIILAIVVVWVASLTYADSQDLIARALNMKFSFDGLEKQGSDKPFQYKNGDFYVPTAISYNGTTYVPIKFVAEVYGKQVKYDSATSTMFVGMPNQGQYMSDILQPFYLDTYYSGSFKSNQTMKIAGKTYYKGYRLGEVNYKPSVLSFNLDAKYTNIKGQLGLEDGYNKIDTTVQFYGDDNLLATYTFKAGGLPQNIDLDLTGVIKLDIKATNEGKLSIDHTKVVFADFMIK